MRDMRDPQAIGALLQTTGRSLGFRRASEMADYIESPAWKSPIPLVFEADGRIVGPLERYGDPRARHNATRPDTLG